MVLEAVDDAVDALLGVTHEQVVALLGFDRVHVLGLAQQVGQFALDSLLLRFVDS